VLLDLPASDAPLTARECTRVLATLAWSCEQIFVVAAGWVDSIAAPETKVAVAVTARVFGWQAAQWRALVPESVLLEDDRVAAPTPSARAAVAALTAAAPARRVVSLRALTATIGDEVGLLTARLSPVSDGAAARLAEFLRIDLERTKSTLEG
jgi:hypothetical protein